MTESYYTMRMIIYKEARFHLMDLISDMYNTINIEMRKILDSYEDTELQEKINTFIQYNEDVRKNQTNETKQVMNQMLEESYINLLAHDAQLTLQPITRLATAETNTSKRNQLTSSIKSVQMDTIKEEESNYVLERKSDEVMFNTISNERSTIKEHSPYSSSIKDQRISDRIEPVKASSVLRESINRMNNNIINNDLPQMTTSAENKRLSYEKVHESYDVMNSNNVWEHRRDSIIINKSINKDNINNKLL